MGLARCEKPQWVGLYDVHLIGRSRESWAFSKYSIQLSLYFSRQSSWGLRGSRDTAGNHRIKPKGRTLYCEQRCLQEVQRQRWALRHTTKYDTTFTAYCSWWVRQYLEMTLCKLCTNKVVFTYMKLWILVRDGFPMYRSAVTICCDSCGLESECVCGFRFPFLDFEMPFWYFWCKGLCYGFI